MNDALVACRALQYGAAMALFGASAFQAWLAPPGAARRLDPALRRLAKRAAAMVLATAVLWFVLEAGEMANGWPDVVNPRIWAAVLSETEFGHVWAARLALAAGATALLATRRETAWRISALLGAALLASLGLVGHAVMLDGAAGWISRASQALHLLAAGFWLGALYPLFLSLRLIADAPFGEDAMIALKRFSGLGHFAVAAVIVTGIANTALVLGRWPVNFSSPYQLLLDLKIALVAIMVGLATVNRYALTPRLKGRAAVRALRVNIIAEMALGLGAIGLVSVFGRLPPQ